MNDMLEIMEHFDNITRELEAINKINDELMLPALCMAIDFCAAKTGRTSTELLDMIAPVIAGVNEELGVMEVA